jgi:hypothetical protein
MFSVTMIPMSTIVPMAMAMPESATMLASTPNIFIAMNPISTAMGSIELTSNALRKCITITMTTMMVTRISSMSALLSVPSVSWMSPVRS